MSVKTQGEHLAIASIPVQSWGELYTKEEALKAGTIFKDLDMPFFAAEYIPPSNQTAADSLKDPKQQKREEKMAEIQKVSFLLDDLRLYLDTHPSDAQGLEALKSALGERKRLMEEFAQEFFPLTPDCMNSTFQHQPELSCFCWQEGPAPWEGACV